MTQGIQGPCGAGSSRGGQYAGPVTGEFDVHPNQITEWKRQALEALPEVFSKKREHKRQAFECG